MENKQLKAVKEVIKKHNYFTLTNGKNKLEIDREDFIGENTAEIFENFYQLGRKMELLGIVKILSYAGGAKYFPWSVIQRIMGSIYGITFRFIVKETPEGNAFFEQGKTGTGAVKVAFAISNKEFPYTRLQVQNSRHKCIVNPDTDDVENAIKRCGVKAVASCLGLGLHLWDGDTIIADVSSKEVIKPKGNFRSQRVQKPLQVVMPAPKAPTTTLKTQTKGATNAKINI